jgi:hypothetical protein
MLRLSNFCLDPIQNSMDISTLLVEGIISTIVSITVLYMAVITYRLPVAGIIGVNVLLGVIIAAIHHYTTTNTKPSVSGLPSGTIIAEGMAIGTIAIASIVATFVILMTRYSFLASLGIVIVQGIVVAVLNSLLGLYRIPNPPAKPSENRPMYR